MACGGCTERRAAIRQIATAAKAGDGRAAQHAAALEEVFGRGATSGSIAGA